MNLLIAGAGGFLGTVARYLVGLWAGQKWGRSFPLGTFCVNISGSFLIGLLMTLLAERLFADPRWRIFLVIGFLGGYTTFSSFEYETGRLLADAEWLIASANVVFSVLFGLIAVKLGEIIARSI